MCRFFPALLILSVPLAAQRPPLAPLTTAVFLDWTGSESDGTFSFTTAGDQSYNCRFNSRTYFEQDHHRTFIHAIGPGQHLEVLSERTTEPPRCRALIVRVLQAPRAQAPARPRTFKPVPSPTESFAPRGNLIYTAIILGMDSRALLVRTRSGERYRILLRTDTRLTGSSVPADYSQIPLNRPVQIRAGRTFEGDIEAFSIIWGDMLRVR